LNNKEVKITYIVLKVKDGEEMCRFYLLTETVLLRQIWDCLVQDGEQSMGSNVSLKQAK
jgi:hypothetical protein